MKKILLILLCLPLIGFGQNVYIPDANFKAYLVGNALINTNGDSQIQVSEAAAFNDTIDCDNKNISDLTGIESFTLLNALSCNNNNLTNLDLSNNIELILLHCAHNQISSINVSNTPCSIWSEPVFSGNGGWNTTIDNPNLFCIQVDDVTCWDNNYIWSIDTTYQYYSTNCSGTPLQEYTKNKELLTITDLLGREVKEIKNSPLLYIYDDGRVEKIIIIE
jgi:hypothetical protein